MSSQLTALLALMRRYPFAAVCLLLTLASGIAAYVLWGDIDAEEAARVDRAKEGEANLELLVGASTQRQELAAVHEATRRIEDNLIIEANLGDNQGYFYKFEEQTGVRVVELHPGSSSTTDGAALYKRIPYTLRVTGSYDRVAAYLLAIETGPRLANITGFGYTRNDRGKEKDAPGSIGLELTLEFLGKK